LIGHPRRSGGDEFPPSGDQLRLRGWDQDWVSQSQGLRSQTLLSFCVRARVGISGALRLKMRMRMWIFPSHIQLIPGSSQPPTQSPKLIKPKTNASVGKSEKKIMLKNSQQFLMQRHKRGNKHQISTQNRSSGLVNIGWATRPPVTGPQWYTSRV
jgi:hypothetical protein